MNVSKLKKNKKGFTLVELVVGTAILAVVGLTVSMLMTAGTNMYRGVHKRTTVFFKSQVAATQLQELIVNCRYPFAVSGSNIYLSDIDGENKIINVYHYEENENAIMLRQDKVTGESGNYGYEPLTDKEIPFCYNVTSVNYDQLLNADGNATAMKFVININKFGLSYSRNEVLSLKNNPKIITPNDLTEGETDVEQLLAERLGAIS